VDPTGENPAAAYAYGRCVLQCKAVGAAVGAITGCDSPSVGDCALSCLNPMNWLGGGKGSKGPKLGIGGGKRSLDHNYIPAPKNIEGIPGLNRTKSKISVQGGGGERRRWKDDKGNIYEWDSQHGALEKYNKRGKHLGEFNPATGKQTKPADKTRKVEP